MQCRKIREVLKTDYLDGEVNVRKQQIIDEHLVQCPECRKLGKELQAQRLLFQKANRQQVPERLWQNIHNAIVEEGLNRETSVNRGVLWRLRESIWSPRPVFALAGALMVIIFVVVFAGTLIQKGQSLGKENGGEMVADYNLNVESGDLIYDLGTGIEEYFL
ncbi:MAG: hypothetical protein NTZ48_01040 [Candidatus Omnitrophica bacterium]|nr:hypothetical protein [Candidatus Omnitrophota bacterium]